MNLFGFSLGVIVNFCLVGNADASNPFHKSYGIEYYPQNKCADSLRGYTYFWQELKIAKTVMFKEYVFLHITVVLQKVTVPEICG